MSKALNFVYPSAVRVRHKLSKSCMALRVALTRVVEKAVIAGSLAKVSGVGWYPMGNLARAQRVSLQPFWLPSFCSN